MSLNLPAWKNWSSCIVIVAAVAACSSSSGAGGGDTHSGDDAGTPTGSSPDAAAPDGGVAPDATPPTTDGSLGTIGGKPFVFASAIASDQSGGEWLVEIYERAKGCPRTPGEDVIEGERTIELRIYSGRWAPGRYDLGFKTGSVPADIRIFTWHNGTAGTLSLPTTGSVEIVAAPTDVGAKASIRFHGVTQQSKPPATLDGGFQAIVCPPM